MTTVRGRIRTDETGDTLIELLFAIVIISVAFSALLGGIITSITGSTEHRGLAVDDVILKSIAESAKEQIEVAKTVTFSPACGASYTVSYSEPPNDVGSYAITGYSVGAGTVTLTPQYWNGSNRFNSSSCPSEVQLLTVSVAGPQGAQNLSFVVRQPNP